MRLALYEVPEKTEEGSNLRFFLLKYSPFGATSTLLNEKTNVGLLISWKSNLLIRAVKSLDSEVIVVEVLKHWQRLKVHGMSLEKYLEEERMELFGKKIEWATGIQLSTIPCWLISESRLRKQQESNNKRGSVIVITGSSQDKAKMLYALWVRFGEVVKIVKKH